MVKWCPLVNDACKEGGCQFWFQTNEKNWMCAIAMIPIYLKELWLKKEP